MNRVKNKMKTNLKSLNACTQKYAKKKIGI